MKNIPSTSGNIEKFTILRTQPSKGYELLDSGDEEKLERFGDVVLRRPDPQALWKKSLSVEIWNAAHAEFVSSGKSGTWRMKTDVPENWSIEIAGLTFGLSLSAFKHNGIFPEQSENWNWIQETISAEKAKRTVDSASQPQLQSQPQSQLQPQLQSQPQSQNQPISVLNLFGYTGGASLAAAKSGAEVCHVDGSKVSVAKAGENAKMSGLEDKPIRWIIDDVMAFVKREIRRGKKYDAIIMDPPAYGHGPKKELWKIEKDLPELMSECKKLLSPNPLFVIINGYASGYSAVAYKNNLIDLIGIEHSSNNHAGLEFGELVLETTAGKQLPAGIFARCRFEV